MTASMANVYKALAALSEEVALKTVSGLQEFLSEKLEFDDDMTNMFEEYRKKVVADIKVQYKNERSSSKKNGEKKKRAPSAYNLYIKEKMAEIKAAQSELKGKELMKEAIKAWKSRPEATA